MVGLFAVAPVVLVTLLIGLRGVAAMRTTSDFLVASRRVTPLLNSAAVSGEYLSAASFLGVAGLVVKDGVGALWYPVGFTAGYIAMLVLVAAPMRRSGALTVPDFAEARLASPALRRLAAVVVLVIGALYLVPQFRTSGLVLSVVSGTPYWVGVVLAGAAVATTLALGGMRAATYVQAFQFVLKVVLFAVPALWLAITAGAAVRDEALHPAEFTQLRQDTHVVFRVDVTLEAPEPIQAREPDGTPVTLATGPHTFAAGEELVFLAGQPVPRVQGVAAPGAPGWERPLLNLNNEGHPLLGTLAVLVAIVLGTMGLPHVIMRFHTSPDGRAARRTAALTVALLSAFYVFPGVYGVLGRVLVPHLYLSGATDTAVVALPLQVDTGWAGTLFTGLLTAGAFAAFLATSLGLLLAVSGAIAHDLAPGGLARLRGTVVAAAAAVVLLALFAVHLDAGVLVTWGFTVAASTFCPLLVLGIWWPRLTARGAIAGVLTGLLASSGAILATMAGAEVDGVLAILLAQPAPWSVPLAFGTMVVVSLRGRPPAWAITAMLRLHLDENPPRQAAPRRRSTGFRYRSSTVRRAR
ncbi:MULTISPECIES: cation acetate symporter [Amycolatopsis]|uniref:Cation acetate symporter n=1 Tax=Amycolatopsis thermalba TaxID=944492 RepID=A0ABY4P2S0_9PSEU|nr:MULTISPECIES: cation acetate symporter [Amycolatopsis]OXM73738.1 cation acetate symporter [Amycolatopsis sp. KNN50.9b]UQS26649.1 cation acetate symporter [Amycolatopsis thermalba]